ncbi:MAG: translation elongation factor Ts [Tissierellia bacterium]|nr:translation elongation factor Ts [Tissierellia bacterium]
MEIKASDVKELRERTGAGMMDCKKALVATEGNIEKAVELLREQGLAKTAKKAGRITSEGLVDSYIHSGRIGAIVEVNSETDFVAKNEEFKQFVKDICMQVAASNPTYVSRDDVPAEQVEHEKEILLQQALNEGNPNMDEEKAKMIASKKVEGRLTKFFSDICLLEQPFIKDPDVTVEHVLKDKIAKIGENIVIRRFQRFEVGEGLEKKNEDFAAEVASQMNV